MKWTDFWEWISFFLSLDSQKISLPHDAMQSAVMPQYIVCPSLRLSVRLSVTFTYRYHIGWNSSKIISRPNSLMLMWGLTPTWAIWCNGNTPKLGWNMGGVTQEHKKPAISPKWCKIGPRLLWWTNGKLHTHFRLVPKSTTLDELERRIQGLPEVLKYPLLAQERVKLQTSNMAFTFTWSIRIKAHLKFWRKGSVDVSRDCLMFWSSRCYPRKG